MCFLHELIRVHLVRRQRYHVVCLLLRDLRNEGHVIHWKPIQKTVGWNAETLSSARLLSMDEDLPSLSGESFQLFDPIDVIRSGRRK